MGMNFHLKTRKIEQIFQNFDIIPKKWNVLFTKVDFFFAFVSKKRPIIVTRRSVGGNLGKTSVGEEEIKKFTKSTENFRDCLA